MGKTAKSKASWRGKAIAGLVTVGALGAAGFSYAHFVKGRPSSSVTPSSASARPAALAFARRSALGERLTYASTYRVDVTRGNVAVLAVTLAGKLELSRVREDESGTVFRAQWSGTTQVHRDGEEQPGVRAMLTDGLKPAFFVAYQPGGQIQNLRFGAGVPRLAQTLVRSMLTATQVIAGEPGATLWQGDEVDENGVYVSQYAKQADGALGKRKLRYRKSHTESVRLRIVESDARFRFDDQGRLTSLEDREAIGSISDLPIPETQSSLQLQLKLDSVSTSPVPAEWLSALAQSEPMPLEEPGTKSSVQAELDTARAGKMSVEQALLTLTDAAKGNKQNEGEAYNALMSHLRLEPGLADTLVEHIRRGGPLKKVLISALRDAGTPRAQALLRELLKEPSLNAEERLQVVRGLSRVDQPTTETVNLLTSLLNDSALGEQAEYGLGGNVYRLSQTNPALAQSTLATLETRLQTAPNDAAKQRTLLGLGNAGAASSLPLIQAQLSSPNEAVQIAATDALRRIPGASADVLLAQQLRQAALPSVRIAAAEAMRYREPTPTIVTALAEACRLDPEVGVRKAALDIAAYFADRSSDLRQAIRDAALNDPDPSLRNRAQSYLASI